MLRKPRALDRSKLGSRLVREEGREGFQRGCHWSVILKDQKELTRQMVGQGGERGRGEQSIRSKPWGQRRNPSEAPHLRTARYPIIEGSMLEFCLAVGRPSY